MKEMARERVRRISTKAKLIIACILLLLVSVGLVLAFAAGFVTATGLGETRQKDACTGAGGTWDQGAKLCMKASASSAPIVQVGNQPGREYHCGDGTNFTLTPVALDTALFWRTGDAAPRTLPVTNASASSTYEDDAYRVVFDGPDAQLTVKGKGSVLACTYTGQSQD